MFNYCFNNRRMLVALILLVASCVVKSHEHHDGLRERRLATAAPTATQFPTVAPVANPAPNPSPSPSICYGSDVTTSVNGKGEVAMKDLQVGDEVLTKSGTYQSVYAMDHFDRSKPTEFLQIHTTASSSVEKNEQNKPLELTSLHMIYLKDQIHPIPANELQVGDDVQTLRKKDGSTSHERVTKIDFVVRNGFYNPLTTDGTIVVDGVVGSTYPALFASAATNSRHEYLEVYGIPMLSHQSFVHLALSPVRVVCKMMGSCKNQEEESHFAWYSQLHNHFFNLLKGQPALVQGLLLGGAVIFVSGFGMLSSIFLEHPENAVLAIALLVTVYMYKKKSQVVV